MTLRDQILAFLVRGASVQTGHWLQATQRPAPSDEQVRQIVSRARPIIEAVLNEAPPETKISELEEVALAACVRVACDVIGISVVHAPAPVN